MIKALNYYVEKKRTGDGGGVRMHFLLERNRAQHTVTYPLLVA